MKYTIEFNMKIFLFTKLVQINFCTFYEFSVAYQKFQLLLTKYSTTINNFKN